MQTTIGPSDVPTHETPGGLSFKTRTSVLLSAAAKALSVIPVKSPLPSLSCLLIEGDGEQLTITANNLERSLTLHCPAEVETPGAVLLPARLLTEYLAMLDVESLALTHTGERVGSQVCEINCGRNRGRLFGMTPGDFPEVAPLTDGKRTVIAANLLQDALRPAITATAKDETRPILSGVKILVNEDGLLTTAGADGFRLATHSVQSEESEPLSALVPRETLLQLIALIGKKPSGDVEMVTSGLNELRVQFRIGDTVLTSRTIDGSYPDYERIMPTEPTTLVTCNVKELESAVKASLVFAKSNSMITRLSAADGAFTIAATSGEQGETSVSLEADVRGAQEAYVAVNGKYLRDACSSLGRISPRVVLSITSPTTPLLLHAEGSDLAERHVVMPMHVAR